MRRSARIAAACFALMPVTSFAQQDARPEDVATIDGIMEAYPAPG